MLGVRDALVGATAVAATIGVMYMTVVPWERVKARQGYVTLARAVAAEATRDELQRQLQAGELVIASYQTQLKNLRAKEAIEDERVAGEISEYERRLSAASDRKCGLTDSDLEFLRRH